jgi:hypothetical protein
VPLGEPVPVTLRLTNSSDRPHDLHLQGRVIAFDIVVTRPDGAVVWRRLAGATLLGILQLRTLAPGEELQLTDAWDQRANDGTAAEAGRYVVHGELPTDEPAPMRTDPVPMIIAPRY